MITIEISGPRKDVMKLSRQLEQTLLSAGQVLRVYDSSVATPPTSEDIKEMAVTNTTAVLIRHPEGK